MRLARGLNKARLWDLGNSVPVPQLLPYCSLVKKLELVYFHVGNRRGGIGNEESIGIGEWCCNGRRTTDGRGSCVLPYFRIAAPH